MIYTIKRLGNGWYDFTKLPQEKSYIKVHALRCSSDNKAMKQGGEILLRNLNSNELKGARVKIK
ncbi:MAG: hypothetical protein AB1349_10685 [Elusimicrobiota bacterium]